MERREPPQTAEGWYVLHDFRRVDWDAWRDAPDRERQRAIETGVEYFADCERVEDAQSGESAVFSVVGHEADLMAIHLRPAVSDLERLERGFERTALAGFTDHVDSYLSVTEVSGYVSREYFEDGSDVDAGLRGYIESKLEPEIPDVEYVTFYPMDKRRSEAWNWYDTSFEDRSDLMASHGEIGKGYAGRVKQIIAGSLGLDDHEWGVTLFADDPTDIKDILYEMRFDPASSRFGEFGRFRFGRRLPPANLGAYLAGETVPLEANSQGKASDPSHPHGDANQSDGGPGHQHGDESVRGHGNSEGDEGESGVREKLDDVGIYAGQPHGEDVHAVVLYSAADPDELFEEVDGLRTNFEHYDSHVKTAVYEPRVAGGEGAAETAVVSLWETERAASTAAGFLGELPEIVREAGEDGTTAGTGSEGSDGLASDDSWGTMGMFYTVKPEHDEGFVETFEDVGDALAEMDGHRKTDLLANRENEHDMFIASRWDSREDAMAFFRSDEFADTVEYGRDVLADRPRHVFLA